MTAPTANAQANTHAWLRTWAGLARERATDPGADADYWRGIAQRLDHAAHLLDHREPRRAAHLLDAVIAELLGSAPPDDGAGS